MSPNGKPVRVRLAPSPTGELHLGTARTALYNYFFARKLGGALILRVEDTDQKRFVPGSMDRFIEDLAWLGVTFDEGPTQGGPFGPYIQSERSERHRQVAHELVTKGAAYYEFGSAAGGGAKDDNEYRAGRVAYRSPERAADQVAAKARVDAGESYVVRLKVPDSGSIVLDDAVRGRVEFDLATVDDAVLLKSDGMGTYHLAGIVDDHDMEITHIFRSEEWLPSTPKHLLVFQAMGWEAPQYVHLSFILADDGKKLSKRIHGEVVWLRTYRDKGYLPEAMINYLVLLGWSVGGNREFFTAAELIDEFSLERAHKAGAKFDVEKLNAFQQHYVRELTDDELLERIKDFAARTRSLPDGQAGFDSQSLRRPADDLGALDDNLLRKLVTITKDRMVTLSDFADLIRPFIAISDYDPALLVFRKSDKALTSKGLAAAKEQLEANGDETWQSEELLSQLLDRVVASGEFSNGDVFWPVRVALTGLERSPSPAECLWVLGKEESLRRLSRASELLA